MSYIRSTVTIVGFLALYLYMHVLKVSPGFINLMAMCIVFAALISQAYAKISYDWIVTGNLQLETEEFHELSLPLRLLAFVLSTIAHWIFAM